MILSALTGSGNSSKYLAGNGTFYTIAYSELSGTPDLSVYVKLAGTQTISGSKHFTPGLSTGNKSDVWIQVSSGNSINGMRQSSVANLYLNYVNASKYVRIDGEANLNATGDIVAYSTGSAPSPFKYWYPTVDTSGNISWSNSTSETTPPTRNIRGPQGATGAAGAKGQGVTYGWSGTSLRLGTISPTGSTSWGSYVNLQGPQGPQGVKGATGPQGPQGPKGADGAGFNGTISGTGDVLKFSGVSGGGGFRINWNEMRIFNNGEYSIQLWVNNKKCLQANTTYMYSIVSWSIGSDMRLKTRLNDFRNVLNRVRHVDVFDYYRNDLGDNVRYTGVSAQQLKTVFPEFVTYNKEMDRYGVNYDTLGACVAIQGLKEMLNLIEEQKREIKELKEQLNKMVA